MIQLVIAVVIFLSGMAAGWKAHMGIVAERDLATKVLVERETLRRVDKIDTEAVKHEQAKEVIRDRFITINERVEHEVTKVEYRDRQCWDDASLRIVADSIAAIAPAASKPASAMRPASRP